MRTALEWAFLLWTISIIVILIYRFGKVKGIEEFTRNLIIEKLEGKPMKLTKTRKRTKKK